MRETPRHPRPRRRRLIPAALLAAALAATSALAAPPAASAAEDPSAQAERLKREGFRRFAAGEWAAAVDAMERAYLAVPHPDLLFNIAVIYDRWDGHCDASLASFRRFFAACAGCRAEAAARKKEAEVTARCAPADATGDTREASTAASDRGSTRLGDDRDPAAPARDGTAPHTADRDGTAPHTTDRALQPADPLLASAPPAAERSVLDRAGWLSFGVGIAAAAAGTIFAVESFDDVRAADDARSAPGTTRALIAAHQDDADTHALLAHTSFGVALVAVATGVVLLLIDGSAE